MRKEMRAHGAGLWYEAPAMTVVMAKIERGFAATEEDDKYSKIDDVEIVEIEEIF